MNEAPDSPCTMSTMSKRAIGGSAEESEEEDLQHQQLKRLRVDDVEEAENGETVTHSEDTERYSWGQDGDWLSDGYFDSVVKSSGDSAAETDIERCIVESAPKLNGASGLSPSGIKPQWCSGSKIISETGQSSIASDERTVENESEHTSAGAHQISSSESTFDATTQSMNEKSPDVRNGCSPREIKCECPSEGASAWAYTSPPNTLKDKLLPGKPNLQKITSLIRDAQTIGELLNIGDVDLLYEKVKEHRALPNRVEVVTNEILEKGIAEIAREAKAQHQGQLHSGMEDELMAEMEQVIAIMKKRHPSCKVDANDVYALLESNYKKPHRMQAVINILTGSTGSKARPMEIDDDDDESPASLPSGAKNTCSGPASLVDDVQAVLHTYPAVDPNFVYELLEKSASRPDRVSAVCSELRDLAAVAGGDSRAAAEGEGAVLSEASSAMPTDSRPKEQPAEPSSNQPVDSLVKDTEFVSRMFPDKDKDEIYAYLEAHYNKPNRVDIVTEELLHINEQSDPTNGPQSIPEARKNSELKPSRLTTTDHMSAVVGEDVGPLAQLEKDVETMRTIVPDCDPMYLYQTLSARIDDPQRVEKLSSELFEHKNYPKLKDRLEKAKKASLRNRLINLSMDVNEFLQMFPDPVAHFHNEEKAVSETYKEHVWVHLQNCYPMLHTRYIQQKLDDHSGHLTPTMKDLEKDVQIYNRDHNRWRNLRRSRKFRKQARRMQEEMPEVPDEYFYHEVLFCRHEQEIKDHLKHKEEKKVERLRIAREQGQLNECGCCYDDEVLFEDMQTCPDGHLFCKECIRRSSEELIGQAKIKFPCLAAGCEAEFAAAVLQKVLSSKMFSNLLRKIQEEEIQQAGIEDLVSCPFCSFATIMPDPNDKVFKCMNPECLKESCRLCSEPNHIPLRCDEVEKKDETDMRTYIENRMTEAMIRVCWKCKKRFYKTEGCNKMTCSSCGASMCYVCRKPIKDYGHFSGPNACPQDTDVFELHRQEMEKAAAKARKIYEKDHPDVKGKELKYDPLKEMEEAYKQHDHPRIGGGPVMHFLNPPQPHHVNNVFMRHAYGFPNYLPPPGLFGGPGGTHLRPPPMAPAFGVPQGIGGLWRPNNGNMPIFNPMTLQPLGFPYPNPVGERGQDEDDDEEEEEEDAEDDDIEEEGGHRM